MKVDLEVIDAFIDGEDVDVIDVKDALATSDGRDYVVDAWLLRQAVRADAAAPAVKLKRAPRTGRPWLVAAGIAASLAGGFAAGRVGGTPPAAQAPAVVVAPAAVSGAFPVPAPTRVIQLEFNGPATTSGGD